MPSLWRAIHELATGTSWPPANDETAAAFLDRVNQESLLPLYFDDPPDEPLLPPVNARFRALERAHAARSRMIVAALGRLAVLLAGEPFIVLKGCDLAFRIYPRPELRPMADIDVLVPVGDMRRVADRLVGEGLQRVYPAGPASRVDSHHEAVFTIDNVTVEIHHRFIQRSRHRIDYDGVWKRALPYEAPGVRALRLSAADAVAYLTIGICLKYFVSPLIHYADLWRLVEDEGDEVVRDAGELATQWRAKHAFYAALRFGSRVFPELAADRFEVPMRRSLGSFSRAWMDRYVVPPRPVGPKVMPSRAAQLWRKFWTMDSMYRRSSLLAEQAAATVRGRLAT